MRAGKLRWTVAAIFSIFFGPAMADVRAAYERNISGLETLVVEFADDGALRVSSAGRGGGDYFLFVDGQGYSVNAGPGGPTVITVEAAAELARRDSADEIISAGTDQVLPLLYTPMEATNIAGYNGIRYNLPNAYLPEFTEVVLSDDPALRPLGNAFATYSRATDAMAGSDGEDVDNLGQLLAEHGVLEIWQYEMKSVSFEPVARSRFTVPAVPLTLAELPEAELQDDLPTEIGSSTERLYVVTADFHENTLYTLLSDGRLQAWSEGAESGSDVVAPALVRDFCALGDDLFLVTSNPTDEIVRLWSGEPRAWSVVTQFTESESDPFLTLDCSGPQPLMLSAKAIRLPNESRSITYGSVGYASATLQHGGFLYVGINAGEWGGGLMRFPLTGGAGTRIDASDRQGVCGGLLNKDCDPVTGLETDPRHLDCILVTIGLVHFFPNGSIVRVCGESISLAYAKPYTLDVNWKFDPDRMDETGSSVAFYSLAKSKTGLWAVSGDGTYHFGKGAEPAFAPFPSSFQFPSSGVDWSNPEFVLVLTTLNQRFSVSGGSLILVPR